jgi:hypothetical protein
MALLQWVWIQLLFWEGNLVSDEQNGNSTKLETLGVTI